MLASRAFVDANSCVASFGKPLNPSNLHHFATPTIGQFGTAGHKQALKRGHSHRLLCETNRQRLTALLVPYRAWCALPL